MTRSVAKGGRAVYGAPLGILMLDSRFPRVFGDVGNAETWNFPVLYRVVRGAGVDQVVCNAAEGLLDDFIAAGRDLIADGAEAISTSCGFLSIYQQELAAALSVPVATSAMMQLPWVEAMLPPGKRAGIVTVNAAGITPRHLEAIGLPADVPLSGTENGVEFFRTFVLAEKDDLDIDLARRDVVDAALRLVEANPDLGAIILECTNMPPYAADVAEATGLPVHDIYSMICWFQAGLRPRRFSGGSS